MGFRRCEVTPFAVEIVKLGILRLETGGEYHWDDVSMHENPHRIGEM